MVHRLTEIRPSRALLALAVLCVVVAGLGPLLAMAGRLAASPEAFQALAEKHTVSLLGRTLGLGLGVAAIALAIGVPFGLLVSRTDVFGAGVLRVLGLVPILIPPIMLAMTWTMLTPYRGPRMTAFILGLATMPLVSLFTARAAERIDARREEAAMLVGGRAAVLRMGLPLVLPSALGAAVLAFIVAINDFALPDYVSAVGKKFNVYAGQIFRAGKGDDSAPIATATALPLIGLTLLALVPATLARRGERFGTIEGDFVAPERIALGRWRWPATLFCALVVGAAGILPIARLAYEAGGGSRVFSGVSIRRSGWLQGGGAAQQDPAKEKTAPERDLAKDPALRIATVRSSQEAALRSAGLDPALASSGAPAANAAATPRAVRFDAPEIAAIAAANKQDDVDEDYGGGVARWAHNLRASFARALELSRGSLLSSLLIALATATISLPLALVLGHAARRLRRGSAIEILSLASLVVPATLFGVGSIALWNHPLTERFYESPALVVVLYVGRFIAIPTLILASAVASVGPRLEEAAALSGAGPFGRLFRVVGPAIAPSLVGSWIAVFALSMRELDAAVLVPAANDTAMFRVFNAVHFGRDDFVSALALLVIFSVLLPGLLWTLFKKPPGPRPGARIR